jgi:hypothetical protein
MLGLGYSELFLVITATAIVVGESGGREVAWARRRREPCSPSPLL